MARQRKYKPTDEERKALKEVQDCIAEATRWHKTFATKVERRYSAWRGLLPEQNSRTWRSNIHQPLLINVVEGMLSSMEEAEPRWVVSPFALPGMQLQDIVDLSDNAEISAHLLDYQMRLDRFATKQSPFMQQDLIAGFSPAKVHWLKKEKPRRYLDEQPEMVYDDAGGTVDIAMQLDEYEKVDTVRDDPTFEPRDVRDWLLPESATSVEAAPWIIDRTFVTYETLEHMQALGIYKNVEYVKETRVDKDARDSAVNRSYMETTRQEADIVADREMRLRAVDRTRGLCEIVELWTDMRVVTVANRTVVMRDEPNPLLPGYKPFVVCSAIPDMFQIPGISVVEGLAQMQEMVWTLQNLRLDTTRMAANLITMIRADRETGDDLVWEPNAQWFVTDPNQVKTLDIDPQIATITLQAESLLKGDIQNVMGGLPYTGGAQSQTVDQKTATGISIITNIAQAILARRKQMYLRCFAEVGRLFLALDQRLIRDTRLVEILGPGPQRRFIEVNWRQLQGYFNVEVEIIGDSLMRQERRAESGALVTQAVQSAGVMAQLGQPLNLKRFWEKHLDAYDVHDKETFFAPPQQSALQQPQPPQQGPGTTTPADTLQQDMTGQLDTGGITNESLAAGPTSPSSPVSMSPSAPAQRALAATGAGQSV